jgi:hypothetical protein
VDGWKKTPQVTWPATAGFARWHRQVMRGVRLKKKLRNTSFRFVAKAEAGLENDHI